MGEVGTASLKHQLEHWLAHLAHVLPAQAPIRDFVHHNTLHGFQHLPFAEALDAARQLTGVTTYWPECRFRELYAAGRIAAADLSAALDELGIDDEQPTVLGRLTRRQVVTASLLDGLAVPGPAGRAWRAREMAPAEDAVLAHCRALTAAIAPDGDWRRLAGERWAALCDGVGRTSSWRELLAYLTGEDILQRVRRILQRHLAAQLDLGVAAWSNPERGRGFFAAWRASAAQDLQWEMDALPALRDELLEIPDDPLAVLAEELPRLVADEALWYGYLERLALEMPGWAGMFLWRDGHPETGGGGPVAMGDYLAVRVLLERLLCTDLVWRLTGAPLSFDELRGHFEANPAEFFVRDALRRQALPEDLQYRADYLLRAAASEPLEAVEWLPLAEAIAAQPVADDERPDRLARLLGQLAVSEAEALRLDAADGDCLLAWADALSGQQRAYAWLLAYEAHYREQLFAALAANRGRQRTSAAPSAQVVFCMDDREEGTRRHLEEVAPDIETFGAAGFFGVAMYWQGLDDASPSALCPVVVKPRHRLREQPASERAAGQAARAKRRERRLQWRERLYQATRRSALGGPLITALAGIPAVAALIAASLAPGGFGEMLRRWRESFDGKPAGRVDLDVSTPPAAGDGVQSGFTDGEQVERVENFLRSIGLTRHFAPLVLMLGHGSSSRNNPHASAYDCGACAGRHGGPNARVFAAMANRPAVRAGLARRGIVIPDRCWFVAAEHNTADDGVEWYDLDSVPATFLPAVDRLLRQLGEACRAHAAERCRRFASAPLSPNPWQARRHVIGRSHDISQARPELGHVTNAAAIIGRRKMSRGLFLDRRVFLISYDPVDDASGQIVESILLAAGPVGAGIALEYYFSTVDNARFGSGSKITHNLTGLFGVMDGAESDLRTGLPWQMVEIHEPMRLLVVVEQEPALLREIVGRQPALRELVDNGWIILASQSPSTAAIARYCPRRGWLPWDGKAVLPQVGRSADWFGGQHDLLAPALLLGAAR